MLQPKQVGESRPIKEHMQIEKMKQNDNYASKEMRKLPIGENVRIVPLPRTKNGCRRQS